MATNGWPSSRGPLCTTTGSRRRSDGVDERVPVGQREEHERVDGGVEHQPRVARTAARGDEVQRDAGVPEPAQELDRRRVLEGLRERLAEHDPSTPVRPRRSERASAFGPA